MELKFDREKVISEMRELKRKRISEISNFNKKYGISTEEVCQAEISKAITIKYLGKMEFTVEGKEELIEKDVYMTVEEIDGQYQIRYYDENQKFLGMQRTIDEELLLSEEFSFKELDEQKEIAQKLDGANKEEAKTLEELEEEQAKEKNPSEENLKIAKNEQILTKSQVDSLNGPKVKCDQIVDGETLGNVIGTEGDSIQFVDADMLRKVMPNVEIPSNQRTIPIDVFPDGSAKLIGEDKLQFSTLEGTNSQEDHFTMTNEGKLRNEQNIETFNIMSKGKMHTIGIGYDENFSTPLEAKYGRRDITNPKDIAYAELETVHEGPLKQDDKTQEYQKVETGIYKGEESIEVATEKFAKAMNIRMRDVNGYPTGEYDLDLARQKLEKLWDENPDATLEELIEEEQHMPGPQQNRRG